MQHITKDPDDTLTLGIEWSPFLNGDTIDSSAWTSDAGITTASAANDATSTTINVSGGTAGEVYRVTNQITLTTSGEIVSRSWIVTVKEL